jgi:hypothetical protein
MTTPVPQVNNYTVEVKTNPATNQLAVYINNSLECEYLSVNKLETQFVYTLTNPESNWLFLDPVVTHDPKHDISFQFSDANKVVTVIDSDLDTGEDEQNISIVLKVTDGTNSYLSADPQIKNEPQ